MVFDAGLADRLAQRHLIERTGLDAGAVEAAGRDVDHIDSTRLEFARQRHRIVDRPAIRAAVRRRDADEERLVRRPYRAHGVGDFEREAHAVFAAAAVAVGALVGDGREELVDEIAVRGVNFDDVESGLVGAD